MSENMELLQLTLSGNEGEISADVVASALQCVSKLVRATGDSSTSCNIASIRLGSVEVDVPVTKDHSQIITEGLESLAQIGTCPLGWNDTALFAVRDLASCKGKGGVSGVWLGAASRPLQVNEVVATNAARAYTSSTSSLGAAMGRLYAYSNRFGEPRAQLEDLHTGHVVTLIVPPSLAGNVLDLVEKQVSVWGTTTQKNGQITICVEGIEDLPKPTSAQAVRDFRGILGNDWLDGEDVVELVNRERGE